LEVPLSTHAYGDPALIPLRLVVDRERVDDNAITEERGWSKRSIFTPEALAIAAAAIGTLADGDDRQGHFVGVYVYGERLQQLRNMEHLSPGIFHTHAGLLEARLAIIDERLRVVEDLVPYLPKTPSGLTQTPKHFKAVLRDACRDMERLYEYPVKIEVEHLPKLVQRGLEVRSIQLMTDEHRANAQAPGAWRHVNRRLRAV
jgi:hypothetical protein